MGGGEGGDHAGGAAADHDDVVLLSSHVEHVIELPGLTDNCAGRRNEGTSPKCSRVEVRDELAADLAQAERSRVPIDPADRRQSRHRRRRRLRDPADQHPPAGRRGRPGDRPQGRACRREAMQKMMDVDEPDYGHLLDEMEVFEDRPVAAGAVPVPAGRGRGRVHPGRRSARRGLHRGRRAGRDGGVRAVDRADRHPDHRLEDQAVRHHRRQRVVGRLGARRGAGVAQGHRHQEHRRGADPQRRGGRRGPQRRGARQSGDRGGVAGPQGRQLRGAAEGRRHRVARVVHPCDRCTSRATISSPTSPG